ncbi:hypothetical protein LTR16_003951 [Cryomyces antarcticus]|uniref:Uncharacterized protein n=1 Tax=Cryomyces antarcticus TaxID=329879 RepID=A0ABR0LXI8_9PEZI|nr:hypothetical protein LTR60_003187 [Cryomyces antarcticus]KAK5256130.1 hypothetical protein LTR16_003951 [Cryomyces antarcticus]
MPMNWDGASKEAEEDCGQWKASHLNWMSSRIELTLHHSTSRAASPSADGIAGPKQKVATPRKKKAAKGDDDVESPAKKRKVATPKTPAVKDELTAAPEPTEGVATLTSTLLLPWA